jgi:uncharacterized membrane protein YecN with MAPEG domain
MNMIALSCVLALGVLLFGIGFAVTIVRGATATFSGYRTEPDDLLNKFVRAHANTAEYAPFMALLILYLGSRQPPVWVIGAMVAATVCRFIFVAGLVFPATMAKPNLLRFVGASGTYVAGLALCAALLLV